MVSIQREKISIKQGEDLEKMSYACEMAATVLEELASHIKPGISTYDLDQQAKKYMEKLGVESACYNYKVGSKCFPAYTCISVNEEIVHGIGNPLKVLKDGDIVTLDICVKANGFVGDNAKTYPVGKIRPSTAHLLKVTEDALYEGIKFAKSGNRVGDISHAIQQFVELQGYSVVRDFVGHGIGRSMHEAPEVPNFGEVGKGAKLLPGMTLAIEPMVNVGVPDIVYAKDKWTALTRDRKLSAHFEHTVLVTEGDPQILTLSKKRKKS